MASTTRNVQDGYFLSSDVNLQIKLQVINLNGACPALVANEPSLTYAECISRIAGVASQDMYVSCQLHTHGRPLGLPERTCNTPGSRLRWNEWVSFNAKYCDLSPDAFVSLTLIGSSGPRATRTLGTAKLALFDEQQQLRMGVCKVQVRVGPDVAGVITAGSEGGGLGAEQEAEMAEVEEASARHEAALAQPAVGLAWLDRPSYSFLEQRWQALDSQLERHFLFAQLPDFEHAVVYHERAIELPTPTALLQLQPQAPPRPAVSVRARAASTDGGGGAAGGGGGGVPPSSAMAGMHGAAVVLVSDLEIHRDSPALQKHRKLARSLLSAGFAKELKPDAEERRRLSALVQAPPTQRLREEERELMWKFRYQLTNEKKALTKLLKCVDWADQREVHAAYALLQLWVSVDVQDLLELLGPHFVGAATWVRQFAVAALRERATDRQLLSYLLPLVQALQYEAALPLPPDEAPLAALLIERAASNLELANFLHWYLLLERRDPRHTSHFGGVHDAFLQRLHASSQGQQLLASLRRQEALLASLSNAAQALKASGESRPKRIARLRSMLEPPQGALSSLRTLQRSLMLPLDPSIRVSGISPQLATVFKSAMSPLGLTFEVAPLLTSPDHAATDTTLGAALHQDAMHDTLHQGNAAGWGAATSDEAAEGAPTPGAPPPVRPRAYSVIFKSGDDLRQDQLVIQMLLLMDTLLKEQGLDLKLTPYRCLATAPGEGLVERVPDCLPLAQVLAEHRGDIRRYLQQKHPNPDAPYGIEPEVLETFVKSCAGYCVIMYLLGVGDRHLDNLMLRSSGALFHIDFGYILGRDPKPFPPPMKLCKEMVEAMGGADSKLYVRFRLFCCEAFNILRASSNLILNLLMLMTDANIQDIKGEADVLKVTEKFRLDLTNEEAARFFQELINDSVSALFPQMVETIHRWAQYWRA